MRIKKQIVLGGTLEDAACDVIDVWHRAERGEKITPTSIRYIPWGQLGKVMTDGRYHLLRHLRKRPAASVRALATALKCDYKNVYEDVKALESIGLIIKTGTKLRVECDTIQSSLTS